MFWPSVRQGLGVLRGRIACWLAPHRIAVYKESSYSSRLDLGLDSAVFVVGSINADIVIATPRRPLGGETVIARHSARLQGGKGANQAAAAARAGARTTLVGMVGHDEDGDDALSSLQADGVDISSIGFAEGEPTGAAYIAVTPDGENSILVVSGANALVTAAFVDAALQALRPNDLIVLQSELPVAALDAAAATAGRIGARVVINNGPVAELDPHTLGLADPLVVNRHEAAELLGRASDEPASDLLRSTGARSVVVTLGLDGASVATAAGTVHIPVVKARTVLDTTGAGDTFVGALAASLVRGADLAHAASDAARAASESVGWHGARPQQHRVESPRRE